MKNFSKISTGNLLNEKKFKDEMEVQVTNNIKPKLQGAFSLPKKPTNGNLVNSFGKGQEQDMKNKSVDNHSHENLTKDVDLRKITTSPIVIVRVY